VGVDGTVYGVQSKTFVSQGVATFTLGTLLPAQLEKQPFKVKIGSATSIDTISSFISLPTRSVNEYLTYDLNNDLGISPYTPTGTLPDGLSTDGGILSGTLTRVGTFDFTLTGTLLEPDGDWDQQAKINASDAQGYDFFGRSVAISSDGNTAIVGAYGEDAGNVTNTGSAYIFTRSGVTWAQQKKIQALDAQGSDFFGFSVAISGDGNTAIVGAYREDPDSITWAGSAYIFTRSGVTWGQQAKISASDKAGSDFFGYSVAISSDGNTAIVGAYGEDPDGAGNAGSAYIFTRSGVTWAQQKKIQALDAQGNDYFGFSVAISGDGNTAIVGAYNEDADGTTDSGSAYIFTRSGVTWDQQAKINAIDKALASNFGIAVAISGDGNTAIVGAYRDWADGTNSAGSAYIFTRSGVTWGQQAKISASDKGVSDYFGRSVTISSDGNTAIVGAYEEDPDGTGNAGSAYIFTRSGVTWAQQKKIQASDAQGNEYFGFSVAISGDGNTAIVGAYSEDADGMTDSGSAYVFALPLLSRDYRMVVTG